MAAIPAAAQTLAKVDLVWLPERRVLMVVVTGDGLVRNQVAQLKVPVAQGELESIRNYLNAEFTGWTLTGIRRELDRRLQDERAAYDTLLSRALVATDELTGFVTGCCKVRPDGVQGLTAESVLKRFKDRAFAAKVEREEVLRACEIYGVDLKDHAAFLIEALRPFAQELQIAGRGA